jgi:hypothetical protein
VKDKETRHFLTSLVKGAVGLFAVMEFLQSVDILRCPVAWRAHAVRGWIQCTTLVAIAFNVARGSSLELLSSRAACMTNGLKAIRHTYAVNFTLQYYSVVSLSDAAHFGLMPKRLCITIRISSSSKSVMFALQTAKLRQTTLLSHGATP